jgi:hypothetical protein
MYTWLNLPELLYNRPAKVLDGWAFDREDERIYIPKRLGEEGTLTVMIDMRYSKNKLIRELKFLIDDWKEKYEWRYKQNLYKEFCRDKNIHSFPINETLMKEFEKLYKKELKNRNEKYQPKFHFDNFDLYLKVYDFRKEGKSWSEITSTLNLNSMQTARNHYRSACEIIEKGVDAYVQ